MLLFMVAQLLLEPGKAVSPNAALHSCNLLWRNLAYLLDCPLCTAADSLLGAAGVAKARCLCASVSCP